MTIWGDGTLTKRQKIRKQKKNVIAIEMVRKRERESVGKREREREKKEEEEVLDDDNMSPGVQKSIYIYRIINIVCSL